jgi:hypothetical protein
MFFTNEYESKHNHKLIRQVEGQQANFWNQRILVDIESVA